MGIERWIGPEVLLLAGFVFVVWLIHRYSPKDPRPPLAALLVLLLSGCVLQPGDPKLPTPRPTVQPSPTPTATPTPEPTPTPCPPVPAEGEVHEGGPYLFAEDIKAAIQRAYTKAGGTEDLISGPKRPGEWRAFVALVAAEGVALGYCVSYDYAHGEEGGRASEMGFRRVNRIEWAQIETSAGRVRTPPGAMRSWAEPACCEGTEVGR